MKQYNFLLLAGLMSSQVFAQNYPELLVSPLASERLKREAIQENRDRIVQHLPVQISGIATLTAGLMANGDLDKKTDSEGIGPKIAMGIGGAWLLGSIYFQYNYRPYSHGASEVKRMAYQTPREQLAAERLAEEHIDDTARMMRKLKWLSVTTNLFGSTYAMTSSKTDSSGKAMGIAGMAASFIPLLFPYRAEQVAEDQRTYKKKVFGPVSFGNSLLFNPFTQKPTLGLSASTTF